MRTWHRWLAAIFGLFLLWISVTGVLSHAAALWADASPAVQAAPPAGFTCPEDWSCRPKPAPDSARAWVSFFHNLHSGEEFGPIGTGAAILSGLALVFFSFSGLWLYIAMWRNRKARSLPPGWFWQ